jgi:hypothetical protein
MCTHINAFSIFVNTRTKEKTPEDPRFEENEDVAAEGQREYILEELRFSSYFCVELWESYVQAKRAADEEKIGAYLLFDFILYLRRLDWSVWSIDFVTHCYV